MKITIPVYFFAYIIQFAQRFSAKLFSWNFDTL